MTWTHYRVLLPIADAKVRNALAGEADRKAWTVDKLKQRIQELAPAEAIEVVAVPTGEAPELLKPIRGRPGLHLIVETSIGLTVDLGFRHYWPLSPEQAKRFAKGDIVRIANDDSLRKAEDATKADLFTYAAQLVRVVDGDTLVVALEVSPGVFLEQKLRLRGLDCPEMDTPEGRASKRFVERLVATATAIVINTTKPDKYDRYLADVFLVGVAEPKLKGDSLKVKDSDSNRSAAGSVRHLSTSNAQFGADGPVVFLNNALLEHGHAVRKDTSEFGDDWGFK